MMKNAFVLKLGEENIVSRKVATSKALILLSLPNSTLVV